MVNHAIDAERAVLGACLLSTTSYAKVAGLLKAEHFYDAQHAAIWREMAEMHSRDVPIDLVSLGAQVRRKKLAGEIQMANVMAMVSEVASDANILYHAHVVAETWIARQIQRIGNDANTTVQDGGDVFETLEWLTAQYAALTSGFQQTESRHIKALIGKVLDSANAAMAAGGKVECATTGLPTLDSFITGLVPTQLVIIAARPAMGKTAWLLNAARAAATDGKPVGILSLEMGDTELVSRLMCSAAELDGKRLRTGNLQPYEWANLTSKCAELSKLPIIIDAESGLTVAKVREKAISMQKQHGIAVLFVDYLQLMSGGAGKGNREQEISAITRGLKTLAKELNICVVALSQLSREVEKRSDKRPRLSDLRESGAIEQDADIVIFLYRPEYYGIEYDVETGESFEGVCVHILAKNRHGETPDVPVKCDMRTGRFWCEEQENFCTDEVIF